MNHLLAITVIFLTGFGIPLVRGQDSLSAVADAVGQKDNLRALAILDRLEVRGAVVAEPEWVAARSIVRDAGVLADIRLRVLRAALHRGSTEVIRSSLTLVRDLTTINSPGSPNTDLGVHFLVEEVSVQAGSKTFIGWSIARRDIFSILVWGAQRDLADLSARCVELIASNAGDDEGRAAIRTLLLTSRNSTDHHRNLYVRLTPSDVEKLRQECRASQAPLPCVAGALAYLGDADLRPILRDWVHRFPNRLTTGTVDGWLWQIDIQSPPEKLLTFLRSAESVETGDVWRCEFAVIRASERSMPHASLVASMQDFKRAFDAQHANRPAKQKYAWYARLSNLKEICVARGILDAKDWTDVPPRVTVAP